MSVNQPSQHPGWSAAPAGFGATAGFGYAWYAEGPGVTRVRLSGELDILTARGLADALSEAACDSVAVILDLSDLTFMDSSGLHAILTAHARLAEASCRLVLVRGGRQVQRIFEITGTERSLEFVSAPDAVLST